MSSPLWAALSISNQIGDLYNESTSFTNITGQGDVTSNLGADWYVSSIAGAANDYFFNQTFIDQAGATTLGFDNPNEAFGFDSRNDDPGVDLNGPGLFVYLGTTDALSNVTFSVYAGGRTDSVAVEPNWFLSIWSGADDTGPTVSAGDVTDLTQVGANSGALTDKDWAQVSVTAGSIAASTHLYGLIEIQGYNGGSARQTVFNQVEVSATPVPEPATISIFLGLGAFGLCVARRRCRRC